MGQRGKGVIEARSETFNHMVYYKLRTRGVKLEQREQIGYLRDSTGTITHITI